MSTKEAHRAPSGNHAGFSSSVRGEDAMYDMAQLGFLGFDQSREIVLQDRVLHLQQPLERPLLLWAGLRISVSQITLQ
jgi:hypothetical protein